MDYQLTLCEGHDILASELLNDPLKIGYLSNLKQIKNEETGEVTNELDFEVISMLLTKPIPWDPSRKVLRPVNATVLHDYLIENDLLEKLEKTLTLDPSYNGRNHVYRLVKWVGTGRLLATTEESFKPIYDTVQGLVDAQLLWKAHADKIIGLFYQEVLSGRLEQLGVNGILGRSDIEFSLQEFNNVTGT